MTTYIDDRFGQYACDVGLALAVKVPAAPREGRFVVSATLRKAWPESAENAELYRPQQGSSRSGEGALFYSGSLVTTLNGH